MSVRQQDWKPERGESDAKRHRDLVKEDVKKRAIDSIANTPIVGKSGKVKVRILGKKSYRFKHGQNDSDTGTGQGEGDVGDVIGSSPMPDEGEGGAGDEPGEWELETEIEIAEIMDWLCEELGLPKLKKREGGQTAVSKTWKPSGVKKTGIPPHLKKKLTVIQAIRRQAGVVLGLKELLKKELDATPTLEDKVYVWAWTESDFDAIKAVDILKKVIRGEVTPPANDQPVMLDNDDLRYKQFEEIMEYDSNAVIFAIMDVSGSMDEEKKLIARSFFWWAFNFLRVTYENVQIVFIVHHTEARVTNEEDFFHTVESGGTHSYTGFRLAKNIIQTDYPPDKWNVYAMYFSDGEDYNVEETQKSVQELAPLCSALGYAEVGGGGELLAHLVPALFMNETKLDDFVYYSAETEDQYFMGAEIMERQEIWPLIKAFFRNSEEVE